jgi:hypothetical protein
LILQPLLTDEEIAQLEALTLGDRVRQVAPFLSEIEGFLQRWLPSSMTIEEAMVERRATRRSIAAFTRTLGWEVNFNIFGRLHHGGPPRQVRRRRRTRVVPVSRGDKEWLCSQIFYLALFDFALYFRITGVELTQERKYLVFVAATELAAPALGYPPDKDKNEDIYRLWMLPTVYVYSRLNLAVNSRLRRALAREGSLPRRALADEVAAAVISVISDMREAKGRSPSPSELVRGVAHELEKLGPPNILPARWQPLMVLSDPEEVVTRRVDFEAAWRRARLTRREQDVLLLKLEDHSFAEIGRVLGIKPATARTLLSRARRRLVVAAGETTRCTP